MVAGYILAYVDVTDPVQYEQCKTLSIEAMQAHGAEPLVCGGKTKPLEGKWNSTRIVMLKFPSYDTTKTSYNSEEYRATRNARAKAANMNMIMVEGI